MTVSQYCKEMQDSAIIVNREYQRSDKVWPPAARSYLVETVLLNFPIPKLSLYLITDVKARKTHREIVDGQQRSKALLDYFSNEFALAPSIENEEWRGMKYDDLPEGVQAQFMSYQLSVDTFTAASPEEVREVFRRMNSYTIPLNDEEQRHAQWQGKYKWFIHRFARRYDKVFLDAGLFTEKALVRMQDTKLLTEVCRALLYGIETTKATHLDAVYRDLDEEFTQQKEFLQRLTDAFDDLASWTDLHGTSLMKPHIVYALVLALTHMRHTVKKLQPLFPSKSRGRLGDYDILPKLSQLAEALDLDEVQQKLLPRGLRRFIAAAETRTNVKAQREKRFKWFCEAIAR